MNPTQNVSTQEKRKDSDEKEKQIFKILIFGISHKYPYKVGLCKSIYCFVYPKKREYRKKIIKLKKIRVRNKNQKLKN